MKLLNRNYDVGGMTSGRMLRQHMAGKVRPMWNFSYELDVKHVLALMVRQHLGYPAAYVATRYSRQWQKLLNAWRRLRPPPKKPDDGARKL